MFVRLKKKPAENRDRTENKLKLKRTISHNSEHSLTLEQLKSQLSTSKRTIQSQKLRRAWTSKQLKLKAHLAFTYAKKMISAL